MLLPERRLHDTLPLPAVPDDRLGDLPDRLPRRGKIPGAAGRQQMMAAAFRPVVPFPPRFDPAHEALVSWRRHQIERARAFLDANPDERDRAAAIISAEPWHPQARRQFGYTESKQAEGRTVTCRSCHSRWVCTVERPYFDSSNCVDGICAECVFLPSTAHPPAKARHARPRQAAPHPLTIFGQLVEEWRAGVIILTDDDVVPPGEDPS